MKKMSIGAQRKANGGFGACCMTCGWCSTGHTWLVAFMLALVHRSLYSGHEAYAP